MVIRRLVHAISSALANWSAPEQVESLALVPTYIHNGTFTRRGPGYEYACKCGQHYTLAADEKDRTELRKCGACGSPFNLLRALDALDADGTLLKVTPQELTQRLGSLEIQQIAPQQPRVPFRAVDWPVERVEWGGQRNDARDRAFQTSDPGDMGPGFIQGRKT